MTPKTRLWASSGLALLALLMLVPSALCAAPVSLGGQVRIDGQPAADLAVAASTGRPDHAARTDDDGRFVFPGPIAPGPVRLVLQIDTETAHHEHLEVTESTGDVTIEIVRGKVHGRILDQATNQPIDDTEVTLMRVPGSAASRLSSVHTRTGADGRFDLRPTAPGRYHLILQRAGYGADERIVALGEGAEHDTADVLLAPLTDATVPVTFEGGGAPRNVQVALFDDLNRMIAMGASVDQPAVLLTGVPVGDWRVVAFAEGRAAQHTRWQVPGEPPALVLGPEARLTINVPALIATPEANATFAVRSPEGTSLLIPWASQHSEVWPLMQGTRTIGQLAPGRVMITAEASDGRTWRGEATVVAGRTIDLVLE